MSQINLRKSRVTTALSILELIYHATVREMRKSHRSAIIGLILNIIQAMLMVAAFLVLFTVLGLRGSAIRGDFLLYIMSGIFLFMCHTKTVGAVSGAEGPASAMMQHAPMNTVVAISSAALAVLYTQVLTMFVILTLYYTLVTHFVIDNPVGAFGMLLLSWFSGVAVGMLFLAVKPWYPQFTAIGSQVYQRANMIASGKMFVANTMPGYMLAMFDWNPLFHCIDQARGYIFINYTAHNSSITYPIYVSLTLVMIGLMGEFFTRKHASSSWAARR